MKTLDPEPDSERAQSETLGVILLVGIAVIGAIAVATIGYASLTRDQERVGVEQAERSLSQFDSRASAVTLGRSDGARVDFGLPDNEGTMSVRPNAGWIRIRYTDLTGFVDPNSKEVANVTLGAVVFHQESRTVGYQGGGVFRSNENRSVLVSRPEFHYDNGTLTIPVVVTDSETAVTSEAQITPNGTVRKFPDASRNLTNKVDNTTVIITVKSRYYEAWAEFFEDYTSGIVTVDPATQTATVQFISLPDTEGVGAGIVATAESGELALEGTGAYVDAYNSTEGPYSESQNANGTVRAVGDVNMTGNSEINGTVRVGESIDMGGDSLVTGDVGWTESRNIDGTVLGDVFQIDGVPTVLPVDSLVIDKVNELRASNDNGDVVSSSGTTIKGTKEIGPGRYYTDHITVDGGTLIINASKGNVTMGVEDWISVRKDGKIRIKGNGSTEQNGTVRIYLNAKDEKTENPTGEGRENVNIYVGKGASVLIPENRSPRLRIFAQQELQGYIGGSSGKNARFNGLVYAPDGLQQDGDFFIKQSRVYGGIVAGTIRLGQYGQVHYDHNLADLKLPKAAQFSKLEFMHVSVHRMNVTAT